MWRKRRNLAIFRLKLGSKLRVKTRLCTLYISTLYFADPQVGGGRLRNPQIFAQGGMHPPTPSSPMHGTPLKTIHQYSIDNYNIYAISATMTSWLLSFEVRMTSYWKVSLFLICRPKNLYRQSFKNIRLIVFEILNIWSCLKIPEWPKFWIPAPVPWNLVPVDRRSLLRPHCTHALHWLVQTNKWK